MRGLLLFVILASAHRRGVCSPTRLLLAFPPLLAFPAFARHPGEGRDPVALPGATAAGRAVQSLG
jgi:hypothetical protein